MTASRCYVCHDHGVILGKLEWDLEDAAPHLIDCPRRCRASNWPNWHANNQQEHHHGNVRQKTPRD